MTLRAKTFLNFLAGGLAGILAWVLTDLTGWFSDVLDVHHLVDPNFLSTEATLHYLKYLLYGAVFGAMLSFCFGLVEGMSRDSTKRLTSTVLTSIAIGFAGGGLGLAFGQWMYSIFVPSASADSITNPIASIMDLIGRAVGWGIIGAIVGSVPGIANASTKLVKQGVFGGLVGGLLGGLAFKAITQVFSVIPHVDILARLAALTCIGALVGFFVGLVQDLMKQAWVRVMVGKNEGKEYLISRQVTTIGRSELSDIGLFGDPQIAPTHAVIEAIAENRRHRLRHIGGEDKRKTYGPTFVNGQMVPLEQWLVDGDTIQIGNRTLLFHEKATRAVAAAPAKPAAAQSAGAPAGQAAPAPKPSFVASSDVLSQMGDAPPVLAQNTSVLWQTPGRTSILPPTPRFPAGAQAPFGTDYTPPAPSNAALASSQPFAVKEPEVKPLEEEEAGPIEPLVRGGLGTHFLAMRGPYSGQTFLLGHEPMVIGRSASCDIALTADTSVSRSHAMVEYEGGRHRLLDAGSSNGVYVDGTRIDGPHALAAGELVQIGETVLRYE